MSEPHRIEGAPGYTGPRRETWLTVDDRGTTRRLVVDYDDRGVTEISREALHDLLTYAGLRLSLDVEETP